MQRRQDILFSNYITPQYGYYADFCYVAMKPVPQDTGDLYSARLVQASIPARYRGQYRKWLRYYLDFCDKYGFRASDPKSLKPFISKLRDKNQSVQQRNQAADAIAIYYGKAENGGAETPVLRTIYGKKASENEDLGVSWVAEYSDLNAEIRIRHYAESTLRTYTTWARQFQGFTRSKDPKQLSVSDVKAFLTHLAVEKKVAASTQNQAFNALLFFFRHVLKRDFGEIKDVPRAKRRPYIPVVLSREEIDTVISLLRYPYGLIVKLMYGCGLRLFECMQLRVGDLNFDAGILTVHDGKGKKDRTVPLPDRIVPALRNHLESVIDLHQEDLANDYAGVFLPDSLERKYRNASKELVWQWFFPAKLLTLVPDTGEYRRYHLHRTHVQKAIKTAVKRSRIPKRASAHTFRHSFASHLLAANYDIRTIQELMGHSDVRSTMVYKATIESRTIKEARSPLHL